MSDWKTLNITECLDKSPKTSKIPKKKFLSDGKFPIISQEKGLVNGYWNDETDVVKVDRPIIIFGDHTQVVKLVDFNFVVGADGVKLLKPKQFLDPKYFYYYLMGHPLKELGYARHYRLLKELDIHFPPIDVQKRIVVILDEAFAGIETAIANTEKNLANARELFESYLNTIFTQKGEGWRDVAIGDIAQIKGGKRVPKGYKLQTEPTEHPYISVSDFNDTGTVDLEKIRYISEDIYKQISRYTISSDDLYISIAGTIGKSGIIPKELEGANLTENACKLVLEKEVSNRYLYFFTRTESFKEQALKNTRTAAQPKLALERLKTIILSLPPIEVQEKLIERFNDLWVQTQNLEDIYNHKLAALAELKQSLLKNAFSGELTAKKVDDEVQEAVA